MVLFVPAECGKLYETEPQKGLQFTGQAPVTVERFKKEVLRCNRCGDCFTPPHEGPKWDPSARSSIILQKTHGMPFHRLAKLQSLCGVPVAASTLWHQCEDVWSEGAAAVYEELLALIAQSDLLCVDDTGAKILSVIAANKENAIKKRKRAAIQPLCELKQLINKTSLSI